MIRSTEDEAIVREAYSLVKISIIKTREGITYIHYKGINNRHE